MSLIPLAPVLIPKQRKPRKGRMFTAPERSARLYVSIDPSKTHLFRYLLEAEDNLGLMTVVDRWRAVLLIRFSPHQNQTIRGHLQGMREMLDFSIIERTGETQ